MPRYNDLADLQRDVKLFSTQPQRDKIAQYEATGWYVYAATWEGRMGGPGVVFMTHKDSKGPAVVYPNGDFVRAIKGKTSVEYNRQRMRDSYAAVKAGA